MLLAGSTGFARADEPSSLGIGGRVRVHSSSLLGPVVGTLTAFEHESLAIEPEGGGEPSIFARRDVARLERRVRPSRKRDGALLGLAVGFGLGFAGTFVLCEMFGTSCPVEAGVV
jgi:hypothetical protein